MKICPVTMEVTQICKCVRFNFKRISNIFQGPAGDQSQEREKRIGLSCLHCQPSVAAEALGGKHLLEEAGSLTGGEPGNRRQALGRLRFCPGRSWEIGGWHLPPGLGLCPWCPSVPAQVCCMRAQDPFPVSQDMSPVLQE